MRTPAQLRRDLTAILADLPRVLAQDMSAEERREYERAGRRARLRLFWMSRPMQQGLVFGAVGAMVAWTLDDQRERPVARCQGCQGPPGELAPCPYAEELYGEEKPCNCCDECRRGCAEEV